MTSDPRVGLCCGCCFAQRIETTRGSLFWLCRRAEEQPEFQRYPRLPVMQCPGYQASAEIIDD